MRETSNPVFRSLPKQRGGYAQFGTGAAQMQQGYYQADPYTAAPYQEAKASRPLTIDDVVTKTGITLAVLSATAVVSFFLVASNLALAMPLTLIGALGGLALVLIATFGRKQDNPAIVLSYAALEGLFLGAISLLLTFHFVGGGRSANAGAMSSGRPSWAPSACSSACSSSTRPAPSGSRPSSPAWWSPPCSACWS